MTTTNRESSSITAWTNIWIEVSLSESVSGLVQREAQLLPGYLYTVSAEKAQQLLDRFPEVKRASPDQPCPRCKQPRFLCRTCGGKAGVRTCYCTHIIRGRQPEPTPISASSESFPGKPTSSTSPSFAIDTANGPVNVPGSSKGGLLIHKPGHYRISHLASGKSIVTGIRSRTKAFAIRQTLLDRTDCVRTEMNPFPDASVRRDVLHYVQSLRPKPAPPIEETPTPDPAMDLIIPYGQFRQFWKTRDHAVDGQGDRPLKWTWNGTPTVEQAQRLQKLSKLISRTFPPLPDGAVIVANPEGRYSRDRSKEISGRLVASTYSPKKHAWQFELDTGDVVAPEHVVSVTIEPTIQADAPSKPSLSVEVPDEDTLWYWIQERHRIYEKKATGAPPPWTDDLIFGACRFCNVYRELDRETQWINGSPHTGANRMPTILICGLPWPSRLVNWSPTLAAIGWPVSWNPEHFVNVLLSRKATKQKVFSDAYTICPKATSKEKAVNVAGLLSRLWAQRTTLRPTATDSLASFCDRLCRILGLGQFYAGQVIADLKHAQLKTAPDWHSFAVPGPGSRRGLNRVLGRHHNTPWREADWQHQLAALHLRITPKIEAAGMPALDAQNLQNCLCETDKFLRVKFNQGRALPIIHIHPSTRSTHHEQAYERSTCLVVEEADHLAEGERRCVHQMGRRSDRRRALFRQVFGRDPEGGGRLGRET